MGRLKSFFYKAKRQRYGCFVECFILILTILSVGCGPLRPPTKDEVVGLYVARYITGEIETVEFKEDEFFEQAVYANREDFINDRNKIYQSSGIWRMEHQSSSIRMFPRMEYCDFRGRHINGVRLRSSPEKITRGLANWLSDNRPGKREDCAITYNLDCNITLGKIKARDAVIRRTFGSSEIAKKAE